MIRGYHAQVDPQALSRDFEGMVLVEITMTDKQTVEEFEAAMVVFEEVVEMRRLFARPDYALQVLATNHSQYEQFSTTKLSRLPAIHASTRTRPSDCSRDDPRRISRGACLPVADPRPPAGPWCFTGPAGPGRAAARYRRWL